MWLLKILEFLVTSYQQYLQAAMSSHMLAPDDSPLTPAVHTEFQFLMWRACVCYKLMCTFVFINFVMVAAEFGRQTEFIEAFQVADYTSFAFFSYHFFSLQRLLFFIWKKNMVLTMNSYYIFILSWYLCIFIVCSEYMQNTHPSARAQLYSMP